MTYLLYVKDSMIADNTSINIYGHPINSGLPFAHNVSNFRLWSV